MQKILILQGLPASGKSTYAKELMTREPGKWKRINKDLLREMFDFSVWSERGEAIVIQNRNNLIYQFIRDGYNVIIDDTNFAPKHVTVISTIAETIKSTDNIDVEVEVKFIDTPLIECLERDKHREKSVGQKVILKMYNQYLRKKKYKHLVHDENLPSCIICDIDGTLAQGLHRSPYDYSKVKDDIVNSNLRTILHQFVYAGDKYHIFIFSGRDDNCKKETLNWLLYNKIPYNGLVMRSTGDKRSDVIVKKEMYEEYIKGKYNVLTVFDDRPKVIRMWKEEGLFVMDCNRQDSRIDF